MALPLSLTSSLSASFIRSRSTSLTCVPLFLSFSLSSPCPSVHPFSSPGNSRFSACSCAHRRLPHFAPNLTSSRPQPPSWRNSLLHFLRHRHPTSHHCPHSQPPLPNMERRAPSRLRQSQQRHRYLIVPTRVRVEVEVEVV